MQVSEAIHKYATRLGLTVVAIYGGAPMDGQIRSLKRGADIVVATPGRALDHLRRSTLRLDAIRVLVLDEADEMLDMGFAEDLEAILRATAAERQVALFSATMPARIAAIAQRHLNDPSRVTIGREKPAAGKLPQVRQTAFIVPRGQKAQTLGRVLEFERPKSAIVFCRTRLEVESLTETLNTSGHRAQALHGGMEQRQRDRVMQLFRAGNADLLVATDVAARGLDIEHLSHVINYDVPSAPEAYVHRIGRTGRIGREGVAITLVDPREQRLLRNIESFTKQRIAVTPVPSAGDLRARGLDATRAMLRERLVAGTPDEMRGVVDALAQEFDLRDIAAVAIAMVEEARAPRSRRPEPALAILPSRPMARPESRPRTGRTWAAGRHGEGR
jgi:ATP-dependent RNA helicase DeaD